MIKESKYIIRKILIGVGIVLVLGFLNGCKVKALENKYVSNNYSTSVNLSTVSSDSSYTLLVDYQYIKVFKNENSNIAFCNLSKCRVYDINRIGYSYTNIGVFLSLDSPYPNSCGGGYPTSAVYLSNGNFPKYVGDGSSWNEVYTDSTFVMYNTPVCSTGDINSGSYYIYERANMTETSNTTKQSFTLNNNNGAKVMQVFATYNWNYYNNYTVSNDNIINVSSPPEFVSWNATKRSTNNVLLGYIFRPEFSNFDTENYSYSYKFNNSNWLTLTENEQNIDINANGTIYVQIKDKSTNEVIDSATFTITQVGNFVDNQTYDIKFSGDYRTENYLNNNISSKSQSTIVEYQIYTDFIPKSSILTYQYQYVISGDSLDNNNWQTLSSGNNGSFTYVASENGTLYARILDKDNNFLKTATFTVNSIGLFAFDNNDISTSNFFDKLRNNINFSGPISNIINIPLQLIRTIILGLSGGLTCTNYPLGSLWGTNLVIPCVNIKQHLGNSLYTTIDLIISCVMIYYIFKMFADLYTNMLFIHKNPIQDLGKRGD